MSHDLQVAGVPGMVGAMFRHLHSLRQFRWALCLRAVLYIVLHLVLCLQSNSPASCVMPGSIQSCHCNIEGCGNLVRRDHGWIHTLQCLVCRVCRRDHGWIHTLLEEAENERMHLLTFMQLSQPGPVMRAAVLVTQVQCIASRPRGAFWGSWGCVQIEAACPDLHWCKPGWTAE